MPLKVGCPSNVLKCLSRMDTHMADTGRCLGDGTGEGGDAAACSSMNFSVFAVFMCASLDTLVGGRRCDGFARPLLPSNGAELEEVKASKSVKIVVY